MAMSACKGPLTLPGQTIEATDLLKAAISETEEQIGHSVVFADITKHPNPAKWAGRGFHSWDGQIETIWLNPTILYHEQEAVAAHELAHVIQTVEGFYQTASKRCPSGEYVIPAISLLGTKITSSVLDVMADEWAADRSFQIVESLKVDALPKAMTDIRKNPDEEEYTDWVKYQEQLKDIAKAIREEVPLQIPAVLRPEVKTQIRAVGYAGLRLRFSPHGLFGEQDNEWLKYKPTARELGIELANLIEEIGVINKENCKSCIIAIIERLGISPELLSVKSPLTGVTVWPKT